MLPMVQSIRAIEKKYESFANWSADTKILIKDRQRGGQQTIWIDLYLLKKLDQLLIAFQNRKYQAKVGPLMVMCEFYQTFKEAIILVVYILFQRIEVEELLYNLSYEISIILILKADKDIIRKKNQTNISYAYRWENSHPIQKCIKSQDQVGPIPGIWVWSIFKNALM